MLELGRPGLLWAGALLALVPVALHLIARRPPARAPLPTARFLTPDPRARVRLERRPTDLLHLALRVLFVLVLAAAFAEPRRALGTGGTASIVLLDGGAAMAPAWTAALESVRALSAGDGPVTLLVFDTVARALPATPGVLDSLAAAGPSGGRADLAVALDALRRAAAGLTADSARAWLLFASRRDAWSAGVGGLRREAWPGAIRVAAFAPADTASFADAPPLPRGAAAIHAGPAPDASVLAAALDVLGMEVAPEGAPPDAPGVIVAFSRPPADPGGLRAALDRGATVLLGPATHDAVPGLTPPWRPDPEARGGVGGHPLLRFDDGLVVRDAAPASGRAEPGARWLAATGDGEPAVVSSEAGAGCVVVAAFDPARLVETAPAVLPDVLARMLRGCTPPAPAPDGGLPLDSGALRLLRGEGVAGTDARAPAAVPLAALGERTPPDPDLVRGLLLLAAGLAAAEAYLSYGLRLRGEAPAATPSA